jgi:hypothetical protein
MRGGVKEKLLWLLFMTNGVLSLHSCFFLSFYFSSLYLCCTLKSTILDWNARDRELDGLDFLLFLMCLQAECIWVEWGV